MPNDAAVGTRLAADQQKLAGLRRKLGSVLARIDDIDCKGRLARGEFCAAEVQHRAALATAARDLQARIINLGRRIARRAATDGEAQWH